MLFVLLQHAVALKAAAVTQPLHDLHQTDLAVREDTKRQTRRTSESVKVGMSVCHHINCVTKKKVLHGG